MAKIDRRKTYYLVLDVETANGMDDPLVYDMGFAVCDKKGNIYEKYSYLVREIFDGEADMMQSAYYARKLKTYRAGLASGEFTMATLYVVRQKMLEILRKYRIKEIFAYNARFDRDSSNITYRWLTKSKFRWFFPYGVKIHCIWHIACQTIFQQKAFFRFAIANNLVSNKGNIQTSAEVAYSYITNTPEFQESHTGLADVEIETAILAKCLAQHKKMNKYPYRVCWRLPTQAAKAAGFLAPPDTERGQSAEIMTPFVFNGDKKKITMQTIINYCLQWPTAKTWLETNTEYHPHRRIKPKYSTDLYFTSFRSWFLEEFATV